MIQHAEIEFATSGDTDVIDITGKVETLVRETDLRSGMVNLFVPGSTGALTTIEYEDALVRDLKVLLDELVPKNRDWAHNMTWGDGNGHSHLRASMFGPSLTVPIVNGKLVRGTWQQIVFLDFDNRSRQRRVIVTLMGEK